MTLCLNESAKRPKMRGGDLKAAYNRVVKQELDYTSGSQSVLDKYASEVITGIDIYRDPIEASFVVKSLGLLKKKEFDTLYHLFMVVTLSGGTKLRIEKNDVVSLTVYTGSTKKHTETIKIFKVPKNKTLETLLELTKTKMGPNYFRYDAIKNNCQDWLLKILSENRFGWKKVKAFIKQDVSGLISAGVQKGLQFITRIAGVAKTATD
jgi:hypothetical protein